MPDRLAGMEVFRRVAALGSLSGAARALDMSQTMATKHLAALESRLGVKLMHRTTRRLTLTEAGRGYLEAVERILDDVAETEASVAAASVVVRGQLRLNAPASFGVREIAPLLPDFVARHPGLRIDLGLNDRHVDLVEEGWDMAIRIADLGMSTLVARRLASCQVAVCASPAYLAARGRPEKVEDLARHDCLAYTLSLQGGLGPWRFGPKGERRVAVSGTIQANNGDALIAAAVRGHGVICQPTFLMAREIAAGTLTVLDLDAAPTPLDGVYAVYPSDRRPPAKVRAMIDFLVERFGPTPPWDRRLEGRAAMA